MSTFCVGLHRVAAGLQDAEQDAGRRTRPTGVERPSSATVMALKPMPGVDAAVEAGRDLPEHLVGAGEADEDARDDHDVDVHPV